MANIVGIVGESGSGKTYSLRNLDPKETFIISVTGKPLPWKGWKKDFNKENKNYGIVDKGVLVQKSLRLVSDSLPDVKLIIIDDFQYIMGFRYLAELDDKTWDKWNKIAGDGFGVINTARQLRPDLTVLFLCHSEYDENKRLYKIKTSGKLLDSHIGVEGLMTVVLFAETDKDENDNIIYQFKTNDGKNSTAKSPPGMFPARFIPNDAKYVIDCMRAYDNGEDVPSLTN